MAQSKVDGLEKLQKEKKATLAYQKCNAERLPKMKRLYQCELAGLKGYTDSLYPASWETWLTEHSTCLTKFKPAEPTDC